QGGGGIYGEGLGPPGPLTFKNTIIANNVGTPGANCQIVLGTFTSHGQNLESADTCSLNPGIDLVNTDPMLGPLQFNGGPTLTHALLPGSPAIDAGDNTECPATDQRGVSRPLDAVTAGVAVCDIGAFEVDTLKFVTLGFALNTATVHPGTPVQGTVIVTNSG